MNEPKITLLPDRDVAALTVTGLAVRTSNADAARDIPGLWQRVAALGLAGDDVARLAIYSDYASDHTGPFTLTVGVEDHDLARPRDGLVSATARAGRYAPVVADGDMLVAVWKAWETVWQELTPRRAFTTDVEIYRPGQPVELLIALR